MSLNETKPWTETDRAAVMAEISRALEAKKPERAWELLTPLSARIPEDRELSLTWLTLLRITPNRPGLVAEVARVVTRWPSDPTLVLAGCDALIRAAELRAPDELPPADGPAKLAADLAERCLATLPPAASGDPAIGGYLQMSRANALRLAHHHDAALAAYRAALATDEDNGEWWWNLALLHKATHAWADALAALERAREKLGSSALGDRKGILWNIAICATALGRGETAQTALRGLGFPATLSASGMPFVAGLPPVQVRVATVGSGHGVGQADLDRAVLFELLWVTPASPCHGVVQSTTHRDASVDFGDLVLWDGTPIGVGELDGKPVPRFPLLTVLRRGDERRFRFVALEQDDGDAAAFGRGLPDDALYFAHHAKVEHLCARCASGDHMRKHDHMAPEPHRLVYGKIVVPANVDLNQFQVALGTHLRSHPKVHFIMPGLYEALGQTEAAGKAHQMWRGLEKTALKTSPTQRA